MLFGSLVKNSLDNGLQDMGSCPTCYLRHLLYLLVLSGGHSHNHIEHLQRPCALQADMLWNSGNSSRHALSCWLHADFAGGRGAEPDSCYWLRSWQAWQPPRDCSSQDCWQELLMPQPTDRYLPGCQPVSLALTLAANALGIVLGLATSCLCILSCSEPFMACNMAFAGEDFSPRMTSSLPAVSLAHIVKPLPYVVSR